jgi:hypothetical protein
MLGLKLSRHAPFQQTSARHAIASFQPRIIDISPLSTYVRKHLVGLRRPDAQSRVGSCRDLALTPIPPLNQGDEAIQYV